MYANAVAAPILFRENDNSDLHHENSTISPASAPGGDCGYVDSPQEQHQEAAISLRRYLQLVPRSPQRAEIEKYMAKHPAAGTTPSKTRQKSR